MESSDDDDITPEEGIINILKIKNSEENKISFIKSLFEHHQNTNIDINKQNSNGDTCLHIAIRKHELKVVKYLLKLGARTDVKNLKNLTQLVTASKEGISLERGPIIERSNSKQECNLQDQVSCPKQSSNSEDANQTYSASGLKNSLHGTVYQVKLLLLFLWRGLQLKYSFKLATEMDAAGKFDDIVFQYIENGKEVCSFLQAKHKHNYDEISKKKIVITENDLLNEEDGDYSLQKYLISYRNIKRHSIFQNKYLKDFIICTNIDIHSNLGTYFEEIPPNSILKNSLNSGKTNEARYLKLNFGSINEFNTKLLLKIQSASDVNRLAKLLAERIHKSESLDLRNDLLKTFQKFICEEVINIKSKSIKRDNNGEIISKYYVKFHSSFINGTSPSVASLRNSFEEYYLKMYKETKKDEFWQKMKERKIKVSQQFRQNKQDSTHDVKVQLNDIITEEEIKEFLNKLVFAVNQPNELELSKIIEAELRENKYINLLDTDLLANKLQIDILDWMKNKEGRFLSHKKGKILFEKIAYSISKLIMIGPTLEYSAKIKDFDIEFRRINESRQLEAFLKSRNECIFNLVCPNDILLTSIKAYQTITNNSEYNKSDSYIFIRFSSLLRMQDRVVKAFKSNENDYLLVIECDAVECDITELQSQLSEAMFPTVTSSTDSIKLRRDNCKKILLITRPGDQLAEKFKSMQSDNYIEEIDENNNFDNLTEKSQNKILDQIVIFQGNSTCISSLVNDKTKSMLNEHVLTMLIRNDVIEIGQSITNSKYEDMKSYYIKRNAYRHIEIKKEFEVPKFIVINKVDIKDLYFLPGQEIVLISDTVADFNDICEKYPNVNIHWLQQDASDFILKNSQGNQEEICEFVKTEIQNDGIVLVRKEFKQAKVSNFVVVYDEANIDNEIVRSPNRDKDIILVSDHSEYFTDLCENYKKHNIHRLEKKGSEFLWKESRGILTKLRKYIEDNKQSVKQCSVDRLADIIDKVVIIAAEPGMGKSTILTHLAVQEKTSTLWIVRINLLDFSTEFNTWVETNTRVNMSEALQFLCIALEFQSFIKIGKEEKKAIINKVLVVNESVLKLDPHASRALNSLQKLEIGLFIDYFNNHKIAILFDGFDEISPDYEEKVLELLHTLTMFKMQKIWITTRPYNIQDQLENKLGVLSYNLMQFTVEDQISFLQRFWQHSSMVNPEYSRAFANELLDKFAGSIFDHNRDFVSIPLQLWMIATIYQDSFIQNVKKQELKLFDLVTMYEQFIEKKFKVILFEEKRQGTNITDPVMKRMIEKQHEEFIDNHEILACYLNFQDEALEIVLSEDERKQLPQLMQDIEHANEKTGIIDQVIDGKPRFVHQTFAEYFVSTRLWKIYKDSEIEMFKKIVNVIIIRILCKENKFMICKFLQLVAAKELNRSSDGCHMKEKEQILFERLLVDCLGGIDHIRSNNISQSTKFMLGIVELFNNIKEKDLFIYEWRDIDTILNSVTVAAEMGYLNMARFIKMNLKKIPLNCAKEYEWFNSGLWLAIKQNHNEMIKILCNIYPIKMKDKKGHTLLNCIIRHRQFEMLKTCLNLHIVDVNEYDPNIDDLPIIEAFDLEVPEDIMELLIQNTNKETFTDLILLNNNVNPNKTIANYLSKCTTNRITEMLMDKKLIFPEIISSFLTKYNEDYVSTKRVNTNNEFRNIIDKIKCLLIGGVAYNYKDYSGITTLQYIYQLDDISKLLSELHKVVNAQDRNKNAVCVLLNLIIDTKLKRGFKFMRVIVLSDISINLDNYSISLLPDYMANLLRDSNKYIELPHFIQQTEIDLRDYVQQANEEINEYKLYPECERGLILMNYQEMLESKPENENKIKRFKSVNICVKYLLSWVLELVKTQEYDIDEALEDIYDEVKAVAKVLNRNLEGKQNDLINLSSMSDSNTGEEMKYFLDFEDVYSNDNLLNIMDKIFENGGLNLLCKIIQKLKHIGRKQIMNTLKSMTEFEAYPSDFIDLFNMLDKTYKEVQDALEHKCFKTMLKVLESTDQRYVKAIISTQNDGIGSPLHFAACTGQVEAAEALVNKGVDVNLILSSSIQLSDTIYNSVNLTRKARNCIELKIATPLYFAICGGSIEVVNMLLCKGAIKHVEYLTALHLAVILNMSNIVTILLENGAEVGPETPFSSYTIEENERKTALHIAAEIGNKDIIEILLNYRANIHATTALYTLTPLHLAALYLNEDAAVVLLNRKADPNRECHKKYTPLHLLVKIKEPNINILKSLLLHGAYYNAKAFHNYTPLQLAENDVVRNYLHCIDQLFEAVNNNDVDKVNRLLEGKEKDDLDVILKTQNDEAKTLLVIAQEREHKTIENLLLQKINCCNQSSEPI